MTSLIDHLRTMPTSGEQTVPAALIGCWRRNWIRFGDDAAAEDHVQVIWLQTASGMGDVRIDPTRPAATTDSSCGNTIVDETTTPYVTADWVDGDTGFAQQPMPSFPEKGWLAWDSRSIMRELAPSGAYVEQWERLTGSDGTAAHLVASDAPTPTNLYVAGTHVFFASRSSTPTELHEFSYGRLDLSCGRVTIELSSRSERLGHAMPLDLDWRPVSCWRTRPG